MPYIGLGTIDTSHFNSTKYPGICKPSDLPTLTLFKNLQAQLNRIAQAAALSKVTVDGDIGPGTIALLQKVAAWLGQGGVSVDPARNILIQADTSSCVAVASNADTLGNAANGVANTLGVPSKITQPSSGSSTLVSSSGQVIKVNTPTPAASAGLLGALGGLDTTTLLLIAAGLGAAVYFTGPKKKAASR
jgi:lysozyme family protein